MEHNLELESHFLYQPPPSPRPEDVEEDTAQVSLCLQANAAIPLKILTEEEAGPFSTYSLLPNKLHLRLSLQLLSSPSRALLSQNQRLKPGLWEDKWKQSLRRSTKNGFISHTTGSFCHNFFPSSESTPMKTG